MFVGKRRTQCLSPPLRMNGSLQIDGQPGRMLGSNLQQSNIPGPGEYQHSKIFGYKKQFITFSG